MKKSNINKNTYFVTASWGWENASQLIIGLTRAFSHAISIIYEQEKSSRKGKKLDDNTKHQGRIEHGRFHGEYVFLQLRFIENINS